MEKVNRRQFLKASAMGSTFLFLGIGASGSLVTGLADDPDAVDLNQFITIGADNHVILYNHRPEMGQGTYQAIPMILAEELEVDINAVEIRPSAADRERYGSQMVVGSRSIQTEYEKLRKMGAAAREVLLAAAADHWKISRDQCRASLGRVHGPSGNSIAYGELIDAAAGIAPMQDPPLKPNRAFSIIGTPVPRQDIPLKTNGAAKFGLDIQVEGMLYASVERSPVFLGTVKSVDDTETLKIPGVRHVFRTSREVYGRRREGVAVLADTYWAAFKGRKALKVTWENHGYDAISSMDILQDSVEASKKNGDTLFSKGDSDRFFREYSGEVIEASYEMPYQAHVPMEPMNAIVDIREESAEFWGSTQNPNGIKSFLANTYKLDPSKVKINYTFMGGGFGRRSMTDVAEEAADLSKKSGRPVKVVWTREDDQTQGPFRACSLNVCRGVLSDDGKVQAFEHKIVAQEIRNQTGDDMTAGQQLMGGITTDYKVPHFSVKGVLRKRHIPISYWRAVYHSTNPFAHECFVDELAVRAGKDPVTFRLEMLDHPRFRKVLETIAEKTDWFGDKPEGIGRGVAMVERSGAHFAMVTEVAYQGDKIVPVRVSTALDLGTCINPDTVRAQVEGSVIMGLGAFYQGLTIVNGAVAEQNFHTYPLPRIDQSPEIITFIIDSDAAPDGAGEAGLPAVAPSLANAIFDLTGKRIRKIPVQYGAV